MNYPKPMQPMLLTGRGGGGGGGGGVLELYTTSSHVKKKFYLCAIFEQEVAGNIVFPNGFILLNHSKKIFFCYFG